MQQNSVWLSCLQIYGKSSQFSVLNMSPFYTLSGEYLNNLPARTWVSTYNPYLQS